MFSVQPPIQKLSSQADLIMCKESEESEEKNIEAAVRASFHKIFQPKPLILFESQRNLLNQARRAAVEEMIRKIDEKVLFREFSFLKWEHNNEIISFSMSLFSLFPIHLSSFSSRLAAPPSPSFANKFWSRTLRWKFFHLFLCNLIETHFFVSNRKRAKSSLDPTGRFIKLSILSIFLVLFSLSFSIISE